MISSQSNCFSLVRCLLIDVSTPWTSVLSNNVSTALSHLFALVTNTAGVNRIPSISIFVIGKQVEVSKTVYIHFIRGVSKGVVCPSWQGR